MVENKKITIVTHSGHFHGDEIFAVAILLLVLGEENVSVVRSRDEEIIAKGDYVVDVGGIYDPNKNRFDHHQIGGAGIRSNGVSYASFGLVWKIFGEKLCGKDVVEKIDEMLAQPNDAIDVGSKFIETKIPNLYPYEIGDFFQALYPSWKESQLNVDEIFMQAVSYAMVILRREIIRTTDFFEARNFVLDFYSKAEDKRLIVFDRYYPSDEFLKQYPEPIFTVFPREDGKWGLNSIRDDDNSFSNRKSLPESWAGKRGEELEKITGVKDAFFCHNARFMAVAKTKVAILKLAELALKD